MTSRRDALKTAALLPLVNLPLRARAAPAISGVPMAGHFTHESARLWLQATEDGTARLRYWRAGERPEDGKELAFRLSKSNGHCAILELAGLSPDSTYSYRASLEGGNASVGSLRTAPEPGSTPRDFRVYMGSCAYTETYTRGGNPYGANHHIFDAMAARMREDPLPHFMLWLGDNLYLRGPSTQFNAPAEYATPAHMELRYRAVRAMLQLRRLFAATHHYAIWDDHDYGANNSDKSFELKQESLALFRAYWPNPDMGSKELPGTWCRFTHQDAEFFLLDNRFNRDPEKALPDSAKAMFGRVQMDWLKRSLRESKAAFKLIAAGTQFLSQAPNGVGSGWHNYPAERDDFLAFLARERIAGLALLSGDRHNAQFLRHAGPGFEVNEFTCSPLTSKVSKLHDSDWHNPRMDKDCAVETQNYGTLEFAGEGPSRTLTARCFDSDGTLLWTRPMASAG